MLRFVALLLLTLIGRNAMSAGAVYGSHPGYVSDVVEERREAPSTEVVITAEIPKSETLLRDRIFDDELTNEFRTQYEYKFGLSLAEQTYTTATVNRFSEYNYYPWQSATIEEDNLTKQKFAEYMAKRLTEHHLDGYFKSEPYYREIYELKDRITKANVGITKSYRLRMKYSYSGNYFRVKLDNPFNTITEVVVIMDPNKAGPGGYEDTIYTLGFNVTKKISYWSRYYAQVGQWQNSLSRELASNLSVVLSATTSTKLSSEESDDFYFLNFSWRP